MRTKIARSRNFFDCIVAQKSEKKYTGVYVKDNNDQTSSNLKKSMFRNIEKRDYQNSCSSWISYICILPYIPLRKIADEAVAHKYQLPFEKLVKKYNSISKIFMETEVRN